MDNETIIVILQATTIVFSMISLVVSISNSRRENQKQRMVEITIKCRLSDMENLKKAYSEFLALLQPAVITTKEDDYFGDLWTAYNNVASYLKINYSQDAALLECMKQASDLAACFKRSQTSALEREINQITEKLYALFSLYTYANWVCIKEQAYGKEWSSIDYKKVYDKYYSDFVKR